MNFNPEKGHLAARCIVEVLGKPQKHVEDTLKSVVTALGKHEGMHLTKSKISPTKQVEGLWSGFIEIEAFFETFESLSLFCFGYMPSSVEILEPEELMLRNSSVSGLLNDLLAGLHNLDMELKNLKVQAGVLQMNSDNLLRNLVLVALHYGDRDLKELAGIVGVKDLTLAPFLTRFEKEGIIFKAAGGKYTVKRKA